MIDDEYFIDKKGNKHKIYIDSYGYQYIVYKGRSFCL